MPAGKTSVKGQKTKPAKSAKKAVSSSMTTRKTVKKAAQKTTPKTTPKTSNKTSEKTGSPKQIKSTSLGVIEPEFFSASFSRKFPRSRAVLYFYPKDNTPGCTLEGQDFRRLHHEFESAGAIIFGVSKDSLKSHENFKTKCDFPFELISDPDETLCRKFAVIQMKKLYGREYLGIERSTFVLGEKGEILRAWRKVKVDGHAQEVLDYVLSLPRIKK